MEHKKNNLYWNFAGVSTTGVRHEKDGFEGQDAWNAIERNGVLYAVVSDGAGSSKGARFASNHVVNILPDLLHQSVQRYLSYEKAGEEKNYIRNHFAFSVHQTRQSLLQSGKALGYGQRDLYCTVVAVVATPEGGTFIHIGDGMGYAGNSSNFSAPQSVVSSEPYVPDHGSDATSFLSEPHWKTQLRITEFPRSDTIMLTSDGCNFMYKNDVDAVDTDLFVDRHNDLITMPTRSQREHYLNAFLTHENIRNTHLGDDKTMFWAHLPQASQDKAKAAPVPGQRPASSTLLSHQQALQLLGLQEGFSRAELDARLLSREIQMRALHDPVFRSRIAHAQAVLIQPQSASARPAPESTYRYTMS